MFAFMGKYRGAHSVLPVIFVAECQGIALLLIAPPAEHGCSIIKFHEVDTGFIYAVSLNSLYINRVLDTLDFFYNIEFNGSYAANNINACYVVMFD